MNLLMEIALKKDWQPVGPRVVLGGPGGMEKVQNSGPKNRSLYLWAQSSLIISLWAMNLSASV